MSDSVFTRTHPLPDGPRVRLRLARPTDRNALSALLRRQDAEAYDLGVRRLLRFDPTERSVVGAFAPIDGQETLIGIAALDHLPAADVDTLVVDDRWRPGLTELLVGAVRERAGPHRRRVA